MTKNSFVVKTAGGAAAQTLGLMNAIFLEKNLNRNFLVRHYPHSTGTYWPLAIGFLLKSHEIENEAASIKGFNPPKDLAIGKIIRSHPLESRKLSWEVVLKLIRHARLEYFLRKLQGEVALEARPKRLQNVGTHTKAISGGFVPILDENVMKEMDSRFQTSGKPSPFSKALASNDPYIAIHFRIGDKRTKFTVDSDFGGDGIFDPTKFKELVDSIDQQNNLRKVVLSDEPQVAQKLLSEVGLNVELPDILNDIWNDLFVMSQAHVLLGSWSQVSQLAAICVSHNGGSAFLPNTTLDKIPIYWSLPNVNFFTPRYLGSEHPIYQHEFQLSEESHKSYKEK